MSVELLPIEDLPEIRPGDDLASLLAPRLRAGGARDGDVVVVTQKIVSKAEGRLVPDEGAGRSAWIERETRRVVARRGDLVIAETRHGFVCANAGVDASNVDAGLVTLLPEDPDGSAERLRERLSSELGVELAVLVTDTFGRAWRRGLVNVAIGCAGLPSLVDLRGRPDDRGRALAATVVALADEVAAASGLVMGKDEHVPVAIVRGIAAEAPSTPASELVRPPEEDLFRHSPLESVSTLRSVDRFGPGELAREVLEDAVRASCSATSLGVSRFSVLTSEPARRTLGALLGDLTLGAAPALIVPWTRFEGLGGASEAARHAEQEARLVEAGGAIRSFELALHAQGAASCWVPTGLLRQEELRAALGMSAEWLALGTIAAGPAPFELPSPRTPLDLAEILSFL